MNHPIESNQKKNLAFDKSQLNPILSILIIAVFIFFGFGSIDEGDPTNTILDDCEFLKPPVAVAQKCQFQFLDSYSHPFVGIPLRFVVEEYEKVNDNGICHLVFKNLYYKDETLDSKGSASFVLSKSYISNDDVIEIYFRPLVIGYEEIPHTLSLHKSDPGLNYSTVILPANQYP